MHATLHGTCIDSLCSKNAGNAAASTGKSVYNANVYVSAEALLRAPVMTTSGIYAFFAQLVELFI